MQEIDQRDRELLGTLQSEIPLVSTPFALIGQAIDMSEKEVIKRIERLKREGLLRQLAAQFDARALGYRSCLVAAKVDPERIDEAAVAINAHPGVTQNYRRNNDFNLWFTIAVSPGSTLKPRERSSSRNSWAMRSRCRRRSGSFFMICSAAPTAATLAAGRLAENTNGRAVCFR